MTAIDNFEKMLAAGRDSALLRFSLGNAYIKKDDPDTAVRHLAHAVELDSDYSAAWKLYGKALAAAGRESEAADAFGRGIEVAEKRGDKQAAREMQVFLRRLNKSRERRKPRS
jgi:predicted Zn-dependent protease